MQGVPYGNMCITNQIHRNLSCCTVLSKMGVLILVGIQFMKVVTDHVIPASSQTQWDQSRVQRWMGAATEGMSVPPSLTICGA